jgi:ABC-type multidrug transport system ATPase subunit
LADEPTGDLDSISSTKIMEIFEQFIKDNPNKSLIIASHDSNFRKIADKTFIIKDGKIILQLGKADLEENSEGENPNNINSEKANDISEIYDLNNHTPGDVEKVLSPDFQAQKLQDIIKCPNCNSTNIIKKYDQASGVSQIKNSQVLTRAVIICNDCSEVNFVTAALYDIPQDVL